jgi:hypothetical protein
MKKLILFMKKLFFRRSEPNERYYDLYNPGPTETDL